MPVEFDETGMPFNWTLVVAAEIDGRQALAAEQLKIARDHVGRKRGNERGHVAELEVVRGRERRVERGVAGKMCSRMVGLLFEDADFGLRADEADIELGPLDDDPGADDGDEGRGDPGPFDAADRAKHQPVERHECGQIAGEAEDDETGVGHFDAGGFAQRLAGGVGGGAEVVPGADAALVVGRAVFAGRRRMRRWRCMRFVRRGR